VVAPQPLQHQVSDAFKENGLGFGQPLDHLIGKPITLWPVLARRVANTLAAGEHLDFPDDVAGPELGRQRFRASARGISTVQAALATRLRYGLSSPMRNSVSPAARRTQVPLVASRSTRPRRCPQRSPTPECTPSSTGPFPAPTQYLDSPPNAVLRHSFALSRCRRQRMPGDRSAASSGRSKVAAERR